MFYLRIYTRPIDGMEYSISLAGSIHFEYSYDNIFFSPLNQNYGMLFPKAELTIDNTIDERCALNPIALQKDNKFAISADFCNLKGQNLDSSKVYLWVTNDFLEFDEVGLVSKASLEGWDKVSQNTFCLKDSLSKDIIDMWTPQKAVEAYIDNSKISTLSDLKSTKVLFRYSDGSTDLKKVDWNVPKDIIDNDDNFLPGNYEIKGLVKKEVFQFPLTKGYADPVLFKWEGSWYFISTNDNLDDIGMYVRKADSVHDLFTESAIERCILSYNLEKNFVQTFWAPEFHVIGDDLYILFAVGGKEWAPQCHMMKLKKGGDILNPESWEEPVRVVNKDGEFISHAKMINPVTNEVIIKDGITLDMTHFVANKKDYLVWSYRWGMMTEFDTGSMLFIATTDPKCPWKLTSEPVLLSRPLYGWENTVGTINNEGPYPLIRGQKIYLSFSGGSANAYSYAVGFLTANLTDDLLDVNSWHKTQCPALSAYSVGIDGPGHNSFFVDDEEKTMVAYHGQLNVRCSAIHRVHFNKNDYPLLNMSPDRDIPDELRNVSIRFSI